MLLNVFKPTKSGLNPDETEARMKREKLILNALACVLTNAPMPDQFTIATMQRYIDGEITLEEADAVLLADTVKKYPLNPAGKIA